MATSPMAAQKLQQNHYRIFTICFSTKVRKSGPFGVPQGHTEGLQKRNHYLINNMVS